MAKSPKTQGVAPSGAVTLQRHVATMNRWRENYNPLRGLVMARVVNLLESGERGEYADLQWLYRSIEKRMPTMRGLIKRWRGAMGNLDWEIKIKSELPEGATAAMAEKQQKTLRARYELIDNLRDAINFLMHAEFRGYALLNKHRVDGGENDGAVQHLEPIDQWKWVRDMSSGAFYYNKDSQSVSWDLLASQGQPAIKAGHPDFLVAEEDMPVDEIAAVLFLRGNLCEKDWDFFIELFGIERPNVIGPANVPKDKEEEYLEAAERIANGEGGFLPHGSDVKYPGQRGQGGAPFNERLEYLQQQLVLAGTGGLMTMLAMPTGIGDGPSKEHADGFAELAQLKARDLSEIFQKQLDLEVLNEAHAGEPHCVYFEICAKDEEDIKELVENVASLHSAGFQADAQELSEKTGLTLTEKAAPEPEPVPGEEEPSLPGREKPPLKNRGDVAPADLRGALSADRQLALQRLARIMEMSDEDMQTARLQQWITDYPALLEDLKADSAFARVLQRKMTAEFLKGLADDLISNRGDLPGHPFRGNQRTGGIPAIERVLKREAEEAVYAEVEPSVAEKIKQATGEDVAGFKHLVDFSAIKHIDKQHGVGREEQENHLPVTQDDILRIPEIVKAPDTVADGGRNARGVRTIKYGKRFQDTTYFVEEIWTREKVLAAKTMYKIKTPGESATPEGGVSHTSETSGARRKLS